MTELVNAEPGVIKPASRTERRRAVHAKAGCYRCRVRMTNPAEIVWDDGRAAHRACAEARNQAIAETASELAAGADARALEAIGLYPPEPGQLVVPA